MTKATYMTKVLCAATALATVLLVVAAGIGTPEASATDTGSSNGKSVVSTSAAKSTANGWQRVGSRWQYLKAGKAVKSQWVITKTAPLPGTPAGLQRYWIGADGLLAYNRLINPSSANDKGCRWWAYATGKGYVVRGKRAIGKKVYLANNDGKLENPGWLVTKKYDGSWQRYRIDAKEHAALAGYSKDGWPHYTIPSIGFVVRGAYRMGARTYVADNNGRLAQRQGSGWIITGRYSGGTPQRYYFDAKTNAMKNGFFKVGNAHYFGVPTTGYVARFAYQYTKNHVLVADNDGRLCTKKGWVVSSRYNTSGKLQRYYFDGIGRGYSAARINMFKVGSKRYYGLPECGYVLRNHVRAINGARYRANNDGVLTRVKFVVYLDAGHGWGGGTYDPGAIGNGYQEANLTSDLAARVLGFTRNMAGVQVVDGRSFGIPYWQRNPKAASLGADVVLSIHFNAVGRGGTMTLVGGGGRPARESLFNGIVHPRLVRALGLPDRGTIRRGDLAITNGRVPCVLAEICYIDHASDMRQYMSRRTAVAKALADSIAAAANDPRFY